MMPQPLEHIMTGGGRGGEEAGGLDGCAMVLNVVDAKQQMHHSEMTPPADPGSVSEDETTGVMSSFGAGTWLGGIGNDFRNLATSIKDTLPPTIGGIANFVHQSAMIIAAEIAQMDEEHYQSSSLPTTMSSTSVRDGDRNLQSNMSSSEDAYLHLPWEVIRYDTVGRGGGILHAEHQQHDQDPDSESIPVFMTDEELMQIILSLSLKESTFLGPYSPSLLEVNEEDDNNNEEGASRNKSSRFALDEPRVHLIRRLLDIDGNLAKIHARLSGRSNVRETLFWKNYFYHCDQARQELKDRRRRQTNAPVQSQQSPTSGSFPVLANSNKQNSTSLSSLASGGSMVGGWGCSSLIDSSILESVDGDLENVEASGNTMMLHNHNNFASSLLTDDSSLVPASLPDDEVGGMLGETEADDSSYVMPSAPNSVNTFTTTRSVDNFVFVGKEYCTGGSNQDN